MNRDLNKTQLYGVALHSANCYNTGYLRFVEKSNGISCIDGILTEDYFRFDYGEDEDGYGFIVLTILESNSQPKYYAFVDLDCNNLVLESGVYHLGISITDENDIIYFTLLNSIENTPLVDTIISAIDVAQKAMRVS